MSESKTSKIFSGQPHPNFKGVITTKGHTEGREQQRSVLHIYIGVHLVTYNWIM